MTPLTLLHFLMSDVFMGYFKRAEFWHRTGWRMGQFGAIRSRLETMNKE